MFRNLGQKEMKRLFLILFLFIFASSASATIYKWVDERGVINFTDTYANVPPNYRDSVQMGTRDSFRTITVIRRDRDSAQLILEEGPWEMTWQIYPIRPKDFPRMGPALERFQS